MNEPIRVSELVGRRVHRPDGSPVGRLADLELDVAQAGSRVAALRIRGRRGRAIASVPWDKVVVLSPDQIVLVEDASPPSPASSERLLLVRDVLDAQIVDLADRRVVRVGDILLASRAGDLEVVGVEVGIAPVLRRLGARRAFRRTVDDAIAWRDLHVVAKRGSRLQLAVPRERLHAMAPAELAGVLAQLPSPGAVAIADAIEPEVTARAVGAGHPSVGAAIVRSLQPARGGAVMERMSADDAVDALRQMTIDARERVLGGVSTARTDELRRLLSYPPKTAGGLMSIDFRTAAAGEDAAAILARLAARPPALDGLLTIFVTDDERRLVGTIPPRRLLAGNTDPMPFPFFALDTPLRDVVDAFALYDVLALAVVDEDGRVVGAVAVDDVLEELLVERLPRRRRFPLHRLRRRKRS